MKKLFTVLMLCIGMAAMAQPAANNAKYLSGKGGTLKPLLRKNKKQPVIKPVDTKYFNPMVDTIVLRYEMLFRVRSSGAEACFVKADSNSLRLARIRGNAADSAAIINEMASYIMYQNEWINHLRSYNPKW